MTNAESAPRQRLSDADKAKRKTAKQAGKKASVQGADRSTNPHAEGFERDAWDAGWSKINRGKTSPGASKA